MIVDLRDAFHSLMRDRQFALVASALLAVTIGTTSGVTAIVDAALQLFRSARRDQSFAVHLALDASRARLIRRSLLESILLAGAATAVAVLVTCAVIQLLLQAAPLDVPRLSTSSPKASRVLIAMALLTTIAGLLTGLWPAVFIDRVDPSRILVSGSRTAMHPRQRSHQRIIVLRRCVSP
jgi:predicted lysophospholipase L1 biosynthesis ABC-type transport system permease subunit